MDLSCRLESHCKGFKWGQGASSWTGSDMPQETGDRQDSTHVSSCRKKRGSRGEQKLEANP